METDETVVKNEPVTQPSTTSSTPLPPAATTQTTQTTTKTKQPSIVLPEVDLYLHLLVLLFAIDRQKNKQVNNKISIFTANSAKRFDF